jgi:hypothetical protein
MMTPVNLVSCCKIKRKLDLVKLLQNEHTQMIRNDLSTKALTTSGVDERILTSAARFIPNTSKIFGGKLAA